MNIQGASTWHKMFYLMRKLEPKNDTKWNEPIDISTQQTEANMHSACQYTNAGTTNATIHLPSAHCRCMALSGRNSKWIWKVLFFIFFSPAVSRCQSVWASMCPRAHRNSTIRKQMEMHNMKEHNLRFCWRKMVCYHRVQKSFIWRRQSCQFFASVIKLL